MQWINIPQKIIVLNLRLPTKSNYLKHYKHIFFDLDHTLWDFDKNSREVLGELYESHDLKSFNFSKDDFYKTFITVNHQLWQMHHRAQIDKVRLRNNRFNLIFEQLGAEAGDVSSKISGDYLRLCPAKCNVFPHTFTVLNYLKEKYILHIITNGYEDVQFIKLKSSRLNDYFIEIITPDGSGSQKPHKEIFEYALQKIKAACTECIMIGDNLETDIIGAKNIAMDQIFFNPENIFHNENVTHEINCLSQLMKIL